MSQKKKVYLEILRLIAIFLVLYEHTGQSARWQFQIAETSFSYWLSMGMACVNQMCVFLFFVVSGAVLLHKEETIAQVMKKRVLPMVIVIAVFGLFQYFYNYIMNPAIGFDIGVYFKLIYSTDVITQYWFLRAYLGFLLILPLLRFMVKSMKKEHFYYFLGLFAVVKSILPILERLWGNQALKVDFPLFEGIIVFPVLGYFLEHVLKEELTKKRSLLAINILGILAYIIYLAEAHITYRQTGNFVVLSGFLLLMIVMIYADVKWLCTRFRMPQWLQNTFIFLGSGVFGVYLFEPQVREYTMGIYNLLEPKVTWFVAVFPWLLSAMMIGILIMNILKSIPIVKKLF